MIGTTVCRTDDAPGAACGCGITRRGVFATLGAASATLAAGAAIPATAKPGRIDIHHHIFPPKYLTEAPAGANSYRNNPKIAGWTLQRGLDNLDAMGIDKAVLSFPQPSQWSLVKEDQRRLARLCNDFFAQVVRDAPTRFGLFAGLPPLNDPDGCLAEIAYAYDTLKADGVRLMSSYQTQWLGDPSFAPVMDELNRRGAVAFVHPDAAVCCRNLQPGIAQGYVEYNFDTTRAALSLWFHGALDRWPRIRFILSHGGGAMPMIADRMGVTGRPDPAGGKEMLHDSMTQFRKLYVDTANASSAPSLAAVLALLDPSHVLFGTDEPFIAIPRQEAQLAQAKLGPRLLRAIERDNALALLPSLAG